jgi:hypothetical protein
VAIDSNATCFLHDLDITDTALHYFPSSSFISSLSGLFIVELVAAPLSLLAIYPR